MIWLFARSDIKFHRTTIIETLCFLRIAKIVSLICVSPVNYESFYSIWVALSIAVEMANSGTRIYQTWSVTTVSKEISFIKKKKKRERHYRAIPGQLPLRVACLSSLIKRDIIFTILTSVKYRWIIYEERDDSCFIFITLGSLSHIESTMLRSVYDRAFISYRLSLGEATNRRRLLISLDFNSSSFYYVSPALPCTYARSSPNWVGRLFLRWS